jgi:methylmalonyl-CoA mutase C-terminal domain/subunit
VTRQRPRVLLVELTETPAATRLGRLLRDAGVEVIHTGVLAGTEPILRTAEQEDPDAVGVFGGAAPAGLADGLDDVHLFVVAPETPENPVEALEALAERLAGGRAHTLGTPSDRAR